MARWLLALMLGLVPAAAVAQDGLRSAGLPERTPTGPPPPPARDIYQVPPDFYRQLTPPPQFPIVVGGYWPATEESSRRERSERRRRRAALDVEPQPQPPAAAAPPAAVAAAAAAPAAVPGVPKTFYVIPGCYAGDRRPDPGRLPRGCSAARLRVVPPTFTRVGAR